MKAASILGLLIALPAFAQETTTVLMATCKAAEDRTVFSLYREKDDHFTGFLYDYQNGHPIEHPVDIVYTNAGARAIVTTADRPMLILFGTGQTEIVWNGKTWICDSNF